MTNQKADPSESEHAHDVDGAETKEPSEHSTPAGDEDALEDFAEHEGGKVTDPTELVENATPVTDATKIAT